MHFDAHIAHQLEKLQARSLLRHPRSCRGEQGVYLEMDGRRLLSLCSNNYLGFANHPDINRAAVECLAAAGYGSAASRHISGTESAHLRCEDAFASFLNVPRSLFFASGYAANVGTLQALLGPDDMVFSDALNHASLIDGIRLSRAQVHVYRHSDLQHLDSLLSAHRGAAKAAMVATDSVFSMDGDLADLKALRELCDRHDAALLVDEAHGIGVLGPSGRGLCAHDSVRPDVLIAPLGKAFGVMGAIVAGPEATIRLVENRARSYVFSTAPPPSQAAAAQASLALVAAADDRRAAAMARIGELATGLRDRGFDVTVPRCPILPVIIGAAERVTEFSRRLFAQGVFAHGIRPPTVPPGTSRLRLTVSSLHQPADIDFALEALAQVQGALPREP